MGHCPILFDCHQVGCWILTWRNITWRWHPSWTASRSDYWWLLPWCRKAGNERSTTESLGDSHKSGRFIWHHLNILLQHLGLSNVCARWAPRFLTPVQKSFRVETCSELLAIYSATPDNKLSRIITGDETWIHHWDSDTIQSWHSGNTSTLLSPGSSALNRRLESHDHNFLGLQRCAAGGLHTTKDNNDCTLLRWSADKSVSGSEGEAEGNADPRSAVAVLRRTCLKLHRL